MNQNEQVERIASQVVYVQEENEALQQLVLEVAANKKAAREKIASLKQDYNELLKEVKVFPAYQLR